MLSARLQEAPEGGWYTRREGVMRGPFSAEEISRYILLGRIRLDDELSQDCMNWSLTRGFASLLPPVLASQSGLEDYQQLVVDRMKADERKAERRRHNRGDHGPERRRLPDRRGNTGNAPSSHYLFSGVMPTGERRQNSRYLRPFLLLMLLVILMFLWLNPIQS